MFRVFLTVGAIQALTMAVNLTRTKVLAVLLGPNWMGVMAVIDRLVGMVGQTASLSMPFATVRFLPEVWSRHPRRFAPVIGGMRNLLITLAGAATLGGVLVTLQAPHLWGTELLPYRSIVLTAFLSLPVVVLVPFVQNAIAGRLQHNLSMLFALGHAAVLTLASVVGVWWSGLTGLYGLYAGLGLLLVVPVMAFVVRPPAAAPAAEPPERGTFLLGLPGPIWKFSLSLLALTFVTPFAALYVHYEVLRRFGVTTAGWMQAAIGVSFFVRNALGAVHAVFLTPQVNRGGSPAERMRWLDEFQRTLGYVCVLAAVPLLLFPHLILSVFYSAEFLPAASFAAWFVVAEVLVLLAGTYQALVLALDHIAFHVAQNLLAQALLLVVAVSLLDTYGVVGAGLGWISAQVLLYAGSTAFLRVRYGLRMTLRTALLTAFVVVSMAVSGLVGMANPALTLKEAGVKALTYGLCVLSLGLFLAPSERSKIWRSVQSLGAMARG